MNRLLGRTVAALVFLSVGAVTMAQTCRDDISATAPDERFTDNGDGTVTDAGTRLMWKQCAEGLSGENCLTGAAYAYTWQEALQAAADAAEFAGYTSWRLPNKNELESLVERRCFEPAINATFFPNTPLISWFWSSSPHAFHGTRAWGVDFSYVGEVNDEYTTSAGHVRLVRGGQ